MEEQLLMAPKNGAEILSDEEIAKADEFCEGYKAFLKCAKTEREAVAQTVKILKDHGYVEFDPDKKYGPGDKVYYNNRGKALCFANHRHPLHEGGHSPGCLPYRFPTGGFKAQPIV